MTTPPATRLLLIAALPAAACSAPTRPAEPQPATGDTRPAAPTTAAPATPAPAARRPGLPPAPRPPGFADDCETLVRDVDAWWPVSSIERDDERDLIARMVVRRVADQCARDRSFADRACFARATDVDQERACVAALPYPVFHPDRDVLAWWPAQLAAIRDQPDELTCERVALAYYSNIHWWRDPQGPMLTGNSGEPRDLAAEQSYRPNVMDLYSDAEQTELIETSRAAFARACTDEAWSPAVRACLRVAPAGSLEASCLTAIDGTPARARRWSAPPLELVRTHDKTCDALLDAARAAETCRPGGDLDHAHRIAAILAQQLARTRPGKKLSAEAIDACRNGRLRLDSAAASACKPRTPAP